MCLSWKRVTSVPSRLVLKVKGLVECIMEYWSFDDWGVQRVGPLAINMAGSDSAIFRRSHHWHLGLRSNQNRYLAL